MPEIDYFEDGRGGSPVAEYIEALLRAGEFSAVATFERRVILLSERGTALGMPYSRLIDRRLRMYELKFGDHRVAYVQQGARVVLLHAWRKRTQRLDQREATRARSRLQDLRSS